MERWTEGKGRDLPGVPGRFRFRFRFSPAEMELRLGLGFGSGDSCTDIVGGKKDAGEHVSTDNSLGLGEMKWTGVGGTIYLRSFGGSINLARYWTSSKKLAENDGQLGLTITTTHDSYVK